MRKTMKSVALAAALVALGVSIGWVSGGRLSGTGAFTLYDQEVESFDFDGTLGDINRRVLLVPAAYGDLAYVHTKGTGSTLWFNNGGVLRNVDIGEGPVLIQRGGLLK